MSVENIPAGAIKAFEWTRIPPTWKFELLGNVSTVRRGASPRPAGDPRYFGGHIPWFKIGDATRSVGRYLSSTEEFVNEEGAKRSVRVPPGSLLISNSGVSLGFAVITKVEGCIHDGWLFLENFRGSDRDYLYYCVNLLTGRIRQMADGTTQPNLNTDIARRLLIPLPPMPEQQVIAHILGTLDDKIELNRRMNETLEATVRAIFKSWFVDFDPVRAKAEGRKPFGMDAKTAALFPDSFQESSLGKIPSGWKVDEIRAKANGIQYGLTRSATTDPVGPRFLRITDIQGGRVDWSQVPFCPVSAEEHQKYRICRRDILVARTGASTGENIYIVDAPDAVFASYLVRIQFADLSVARVVSEYMRTPTYFDYVAGAIGGSAQPNASAQVLASAAFAFPPVCVARRFADLAEPFDRQRVENTRQIETLTSIRDTLLPKLISGELRVKHAMKSVEMV